MKASLVENAVRRGRMAFLFVGRGPQRLKPRLHNCLCGTTEVVPFPFVPRRVSRRESHQR